MRSGLKAEAHAVLAKHGLAVPMSDLFGVGGRQLPTHLCTTDVRYHSAYVQRIESLVALVDAFTGEIDELTDSIARLLGDHRGDHAIQQLPGVGPVLAAIFVAGIGDVDRFASASHLASWCGVTPRHHESDTPGLQPTQRGSPGENPCRTHLAPASQPNTLSTRTTTVRPVKRALDKDSPSGETELDKPLQR